MTALWRELWGHSHRRSLAFYLAWWISVLAFSLAAQILLERYGLLTGEPLIAQLQLLSLLLVLSLPLAAGFLAFTWRLRRGGRVPGLLSGLAASLVAGVVSLEALVLGLLGLSALILYVLPSGGSDESVVSPVLVPLVLASLPAGSLLGLLGGVIDGLVSWTVRQVRRDASP